MAREQVRRLLGRAIEPQATVAADEPAGVPLTVPYPGVPEPIYVRPSNAPRAPAQVTRLRNGIRVVSESAFGTACTVGVLVQAGARFEDDALSGVSHFVDRLAFKVRTRAAAMHACAPIGGARRPADRPDGRARHAQPTRARSGERAAI